MIKASIIFLTVFLFFTTTGYAQFREYMVEGNVLDTDKSPLPGVVIELQEKGTSRNYSFETDKKGHYKIVGLPHGVYVATFRKQGYKDISTEWNLNAPQERIQKVKMDDAIMISSELLAKMEQNKAIKSKMDTAKQKFEERDFDAVISILKEVLVSYPDDVYSTYLTGMAYVSKGDIDSGLLYLIKVKEKAPDFAEAYIQIGFCYQKRNELDLAIENYKKADELKPKQFMVLYNLGMIYYLQQKAELAIAALESALEFKQVEAEIFETIGLCQIQLKDFIKAVSFLEKALEKTNDEAKKTSLSEMIKTLNGSK